MTSKFHISFLTFRPTYPVSRCPIAGLLLTWAQPGQEYTCRYLTCPLFLFTPFLPYTVRGFLVLHVWTPQPEFLNSIHTPLKEPLFWSFFGLRSIVKRQWGSPLGGQPAEKACLWAESGPGPLRREFGNPRNEKWSRSESGCVSSGKSCPLSTTEEGLARGEPEWGPSKVWGQEQCPQFSKSNDFNCSCRYLKLTYANLNLSSTSFSSSITAYPQLLYSLRSIFE